MAARLSLAFPLLCLILVIGVMVYNGYATSLTQLEDIGAAQRLMCVYCSNDLGGMEPVRKVIDGKEEVFCCHTCEASFENGESLGEMPGGVGANVDLVCLMEVGDGIATEYQNIKYFFCTDMCRKLFNGDPEIYLQEICLVCKAEGELTPVPKSEHKAVWQDRTYTFCTANHIAKFNADPAGYFMHTMWGIPVWLYYSSIAIILMMSFLIIEARTGKKKKQPRPRIDLLRIKWINRMFKHNATRFIGRLIFVAWFVLIVIAGLFGNQLPQKNIAPLITWTIWWGGLIWLVAYLGKAFCYVCPWDAISDWAEGLRFWGTKKDGLGLGLKWPKSWRNIWPATVLFIALTWIELGFGVTMIPRATAWLALTMLVLTFASAFIFDRRSFCRYGCLVGRISGLYALFAPVELRSRDTEICRTCDTHSCFKGNAQGEPCPTFEFMGTMQQNTYCISCMECVKSCEQDNIALNIRPWGEDLAEHHKPRADEAYLGLIMLALTGFHGLTMTAAWQVVIDWIVGLLHVSETVAFSIGMLAIMFGPVALYAGLVWLSRILAAVKTVGYREYFIRYAYALLPIALFYHLAHNSEHLLMEGQKLIALLSDPLGMEWNLFGTASWRLEPMISLQYLWLIQVLFVMIGHVYSLWTARRAAGEIFSDPSAARRSQFIMLVAMILFSLMSLWLLKQPMEMRTSAM